MSARPAALSSARPARGAGRRSDAPAASGWGSPALGLAEITAPTHPPAAARGAREPARAGPRRPARSLRYGGRRRPGEGAWSCAPPPDTHHARLEAGPSRAMRHPCSGRRAGPWCCAADPCSRRRVAPSWRSRTPMTVRSDAALPDLRQARSGVTARQPVLQSALRGNRPRPLDDRAIRHPCPAAGLMASLRQAEPNLAGLCEDTTGAS